MNKKIKVGFLHSLIRKDEKFLIDEFIKREDVELIMIDDRTLNFDLHKNNFDYDVIVERCINHSRAL
ncbi:MAG: lysine biosynthesis protein LysX, partial [Candidatus Woesearchaeota archaeon]